MFRFQDSLKNPTFYYFEIQIVEKHNLVLISVFVIFPIYTVVEKNFVVDFRSVLHVIKMFNKLILIIVLHRRMCFTKLCVIMCWCL